MFSEPVVYYEFFVLCVFIVWFVVTILCQPDGWKLAQRIRAFDHLGIIPLWTFFAPNPGKQDYHLLYRDKLHSGVLSDWVEVDLQEERYVYSCFWNPDKRDKKVLSDVVQNLISLHGSPQADHRSLPASLPYLTVLKLVCTQQRIRTESTYRQFMLAGSFGYNSDKAPEFIMLSLFHPF